MSVSSSPYVPGPWLARDTRDTGTFVKLLLCGVVVVVVSLGMWLLCRWFTRDTRDHGTFVRF